MKECRIQMHYFEQYLVSQCFLHRVLLQYTIPSTPTFTEEKMSLLDSLDACTGLAHGRSTNLVWLGKPTASAGMYQTLASIHLSTGGLGHLE